MKEGGKIEVVACVCASRWVGCDLLCLLCCAVSESLEEGGGGGELPCGHEIDIPPG